MPAGPVALVTHSGSVFSTLLRARRGFGFSLAVSSGQELVTTAAAYARYALSLPETRVLALVLEAIRDAADLRSVLAARAGRGRAGRAAQRGRLRRRPGAGLGPFRRAGRRRRRVGGAGRRLRRAPRRRPGRAGRHPRALRQRPPGRPAPSRPAPRPGPRASPPCTTPAWNARTSPTWPPSSACRSPPLAPRDPRPAGRGARPRPGAGQPARRVGDRPRHRAAVRRVPVRAGRRPGGRRGRAGRRPGPRVRRRRLLPAGGARGRRPTPANRSRCWPGCPPPSTRPPRPGCARPGSRSSKAPAAACSPCATCSTTPVRATRPRPPAPPPPGRRRQALAGDAGPPPRRPGRRRPVRPAARLRHPRRCAPSRPRPAARPWRRRPRSATRPCSRPTSRASRTNRTSAGSGSASATPARLGAAYDDLAARLGPRVLVCETAAPGTELALGVVRDAALGPLLVISAGGVLIEIFVRTGRTACPGHPFTPRWRPWPGSAWPPCWPEPAASPRLTWTRSRTRSPRCPAWPASSATCWTRWTSTP